MSVCSSLLTHTGVVPDVRYTLFDTAIGRCALAWGDRGVVGVQLPEGSDGTTRERIRAAFPAAVESGPDAVGRRAVEAVTELLVSGQDPSAQVPLDLSQVPDFDARVYAVTRTITAGSTLTYGEVADRVGSPGAAQAVGQALGRNPIPLLVPCHRVLAAGGKVGGFSAHGGAVTKRVLLALEHVPGFDEPTLF
ncbi:methylated-DNA-[protein]-cysteine S-methyltransferase [Rhodococcus tukisamuensis]|uniref:methylated-DNA--[protein]-cysteine S-methyltransferase n=1 Tax=Rhodococcus tukisamuensis TaxID=168276 RepID=A0A1G6VN35_9NOCA|nr:methylated-DNA-[protein]-cysteine S-methyltransferase [Rhodococcus tukisamuensis]